MPHKISLSLLMSKDIVMSNLNEYLQVHQAFLNICIIYHIDYRSTKLCQKNNLIYCYLD